MVKNYIFFEKLSVNALISTVGIRIPTKNLLKKNPCSADIVLLLSHIGTHS